MMCPMLDGGEANTAMLMGNLFEIYSSVCVCVSMWCGCAFVFNSYTWLGGLFVSFDKVFLRHHVEM